MFKYSDKFFYENISNPCALQNWKKLKYGIKTISYIAPKI